MSSLGTMNELAMMITSIRRIIRPGETFLYLLIIRAIISVPPVLPPCVKVIPIPAPEQAPPMIAASNLPFSIEISFIRSAGIICGKKSRNIELTMIAKTVFAPNPLPKIFNANPSRTAFIKKKV